MAQASRLNGLSSDGMQPWHLKANYQTFDAGGKPKDKGVFEEWWAGPEKYKVSYTSSGFNQVRYKTTKKLLMTGDDSAPSLADSMLERFVAHPIPSPKAINEVIGRVLKFEVKNANDGPVALNCIREKTGFIDPVFCFQKGSPAVRLETLIDGYMVMFNDIVSMDGKFVSRQIYVRSGDLPVLSEQVTTLEPLTKVDDAEFAPPPQAVTALLPPQFESAYDVHLISMGKQPKTPPIAKAAHVHGTVIMAVIVSPKGDVSEVRAISGPAMLRQAAMEEVKSFRFEPFKVKGQPTAMELLIHSDFHD